MSTVRMRSFSLTNDVANVVLVPLLKSRAGHRLGRRLAVVEYRGRHSGRRRHLVTQYVLHGRTVRIGVGRAPGKTWWRNFRSGYPVRLWLAGEAHDLTAHVERQGDRVDVVAELPLT